MKVSIPHKKDYKGGIIMYLKEPDKVISVFEEFGFKVTYKHSHLLGSELSWKNRPWMLIDVIRSGNQFKVSIQGGNYISLKSLDQYIKEIEQAKSFLKKLRSIDQELA